MGDIGNWEFAAAAGAIVIGLAGLIVLGVVATLSSWRILERTLAAAREATSASAALRALISRMPDQQPTSARFRALDDEKSLMALRHEADALLEQQRRLGEAVQNLEAEARARGGDDIRIRELQASLRRLDAGITRLADAVAEMGGGARGEEHHERDLQDRQ